MSMGRWLCEDEQGELHVATVTFFTRPNGERTFKVVDMDGIVRLDLAPKSRIKIEWKPATLDQVADTLEFAFREDLQQVWNNAKAEKLH